MQVIEHIFDVLGGATAIARATGDPVQTVHSWKAKDSIPPWRRASVLNVPTLPDRMLSAEAVAYLKSSDRAPQIAA